MRTEKYHQIKRKRSYILQVILSIIILLGVFAGGLLGYYGSKVETFLTGISSDETAEQSIELAEISKQIENKEPFSTLILGVDIDQAGTSRSDTIILVTVNPEKESMKMISIPRDTLITLPNGNLEKINAAYTIGGPNLAKKMIEEKFDIPINFFATMDFDGLIELVDAVGGIRVNSELEFTEMNHAKPSQPVEIKKGLQYLDGAQALGYARMRKKDPRGDFGRQDRQKEVIEQILEKLVSLKTLTNLTAIMDAIQPYLSTNATSNQMIGIASSYSSVLNNVEHLSLNGESSSEYFPHYGLTVYVWEPNKESIEKVSEELREHLDLDESSNKKLGREAEKKIATPKSARLIEY